MSVKQTRSEAQRLLMAVVRATAEVQTDIRLQTDVFRLHVQRGTEGSRTIGRCAHAALYLHGLYATGKVAHVDPIDLCTLGIVQRYAVGGDVDT